MSYHLEGHLLEVCNCRVLCPCWFGEDPDQGSCDAITAWHFSEGQIDGVEISGCTIALVTHTPGNILAGNRRVAVYIDETASQQQQDAILSVWTGKHGGPVGELSKLVGEVVSVERAPIAFVTTKGSGKMKIGEISCAELEPCKSTVGNPTKLSDTVYSPVPGNPVFINKASRYRSKNHALGIDLDIGGCSAVQSTFCFDV